MNTVHSVRDGAWSDPGTWDGDVATAKFLQIGHVVTVTADDDVYPLGPRGQGLYALVTPTHNAKSEKWLRRGYVRQEAIRVYRLFHPNRWNLKRAKWLARRAK